MGMGLRRSKGEKKGLQERKMKLSIGNQMRPSTIKD